MRAENKSMNFNLDIKNYSFKEILKLFDLNDNQVITTQDMKKAKMKVLSMHPDKLKLSFHTMPGSKLVSFISPPK